MDLLDAFARWARVEGRSPRTIDNYRWSLKRLARAGIARLEDATPVWVGSYIEHRVAEVSAISAVHDLAALIAVVRFLATRGEAEPATLTVLKGLRPRLIRPRALHARFFSRDEFERLKAAARSQRTNGRAAELVIVVAVLSGLRAGELARLRWSDVDLDRRVIRVRIDLELGDRGRIKTNSERLVPIVEELRQHLLAWPEREGFVFPNGPKARVNVAAPPIALHHRVVRARERAGIHDATLNIARHTRASWWIAAGVPLVKCCKWMGHSIQTAQHFYWGLLEGYDEDAELVPDAQRAPAA